MSHVRDAAGGLRVELAHALGFPDYPVDSTAEPYLSYISNRYIGRGTLEEYLKLVMYVVRHFEANSHDTSLPLNSIQELLDTLSTSTEEYFSDTQAASAVRRDDVEDTVLYVIGVWTLLLSSFVHLPVAGGARKVALAYAIRAQESASALSNHPYGETVSGLIRGSGLLPVAGQWGLPTTRGDDNGRIHAAARLLTMLREPQSPAKDTTASILSSVSSVSKVDSTEPVQSHESLRFLDDLDSFESLNVAATRLNAYILSLFGVVDVAWTHNVSRHMLLSKRGSCHVLEIFALPCALSAATFTSDAVGYTPEFAQEVRESYCILFNAWSDIPRHARFGRFLGIRRFCWCWSCSSRRHRNQVVSSYRDFSQKRSPGAKRRAKYTSEYDPLLVELMGNEPSDWTPDLFPSLWSRVMVLEQHLQAAKPWSIWILFRDRRDTLQFWTFL
jgi:hypothetical protein